MVVGGMFNVLEMAIKVIQDTPENGFTKEEIKKVTGLSDQAVTNNLCRLMKSGFIVKETYCVKGVQGRITKYKIVGGDIDELVRLYFS